ncbi:MAG TPA: PEGA domain-containing protein, partial [Acidobacteriota bacterium]
MEKQGITKLYMKIGALAVCFFVQSLAGADLTESKRVFDQAEKAFYSGNPSDCIPLFESLTKRLIAETIKRTLEPEERSLLERSLDYLAQTYFNQNDLPNAKASLVKLFAINPEYQLNEELVSVKVIDLFNATKKETLSRLSITTTPFGADIFLDGRRIGISDLQSYAVVGEHSIEVKKPGYLPDKRQITIAPPAPAILQIELKQDPAGLQLYQDAKKFLDSGDFTNARTALEKG